MGEESKRWEPEDRKGAYADLNHPADVFLEVWGKGLSELFENALFALYDHLAELEDFETGRNETITVEEADPAAALRALLSEALYRFAAHKFVAIRAKIEVKTTATSQVRVEAHLSGETIDERRHTLIDEIKAVTYHQLSVEAQPEGGWRATVLFDV
jgi:SHS2 domain-containing protein